MFQVSGQPPGHDHSGGLQPIDEVQDGETLVVQGGRAARPTLPSTPGSNLGTQFSTPACRQALFFAKKRALGGYTNGRGP